MVAPVCVSEGGSLSGEQNIAGYCDPLLAGSLPATTDGNTASWLAENLAGLRAVLGR